MNAKYLLFILLLFCGCSINPDKTYRVYIVTDASGKTHNNLNHIYGNEYRDQQNREYRFHGNYTVISSTISGHDLLKLKTERE